MAYQKPLQPYQDRPRVTKYFLVREKSERFLIGASYGAIAGFSFNFLPNVKPIYKDYAKFIYGKVAEGYQIVDSGGNYLFADELLKFAAHCVPRKCFFTRRRDWYGYSYTTVNETPKKKEYVKR